MAHWSFYAGFFTGIGIIATGVALKNYFTLRSTLVYNAALKQVVNKLQFQEKLGLPIKPGRFRAYSYEYPDVKGESHDVSVIRKMMV